MYVAIAIKRIILQKICFKRIREEKSKGDKPTCYNMFNVSGTAAPLLVNVKIDNKNCYYGS